MMHEHSKDPSQNQHQSEESSPHKMNMGNRGVTRPMHSDDSDGKMMSVDDRMHMLHMHHQQTLWVYWMIIILGIWTILSPLTFAYHLSIVAPGGGRSLWLTDAQRVTYMKWSDIISGALLIVFGFRSLLPNRPVSLWICCFIGVWMSIAPLLFWAPTAAAYLNDTLVGMLIVSLSVLIPGMPNMMMYMKMGSEVPSGWTYNPSSWAQRWIMIVTGFIGFIVSRYLAAYQLGYLDSVWDPFFDSSSKQVLNSSMSHSLPFSDAGLGSLAYTFEFLMGFMGSPSRWRTMPWMVTFFGILVMPLGLVHIFLVISQPLTVGAWCFFCLIAAGVMLPMIPLEIDEVVAMGQHMVQTTRKGEKFWRVFWKGGNPVEHNKDERSPEIMSLNKDFGKVFKASTWGMSVPWTLLATFMIGIVLVTIPDQAGVPIKSSFADINHLCGSLIVVASVISMGEVVRSFRFLNLLLALAFAVLPWFVTDVSLWLKMVDVMFGIIVAVLSVPRGIIKEQYGLWTKYIK